jgi:3-phytase
MQTRPSIVLLAFLLLHVGGCISENNNILKPLIITDSVFGDSDDPAIWINEKFQDSSIILGTDKDKINGGIYVFNLSGKIDSVRSKWNLKRVNNIDIANKFVLGKDTIAIAVATERDNNALRVLSVPAMDFIDNNGIKVFTDDSLNLPMGIALYTRPKDNKIFAIVGRKEGPKDGYLYQYLLFDNGGKVNAKLVRKFGKFSGKKEIESIAVDNELGFVYYSDEQYGIRKYFADPDSSNVELAVFGKNEFKDDNEGISIYKKPGGKGYILVSNQIDHSFNIYLREGDKNDIHHHRLIKNIKVSAQNSDGSEITSVSLPGFKDGLFVVMSDNKTYHYYSWSQINEKLHD